MDRLDTALRRFDKALHDHSILASEHLLGKSAAEHHEKEKVRRKIVLTFPLVGNGEISKMTKNIVDVVYRRTFEDGVVTRVILSKTF